MSPSRIEYAAEEIGLKCCGKLFLLWCSWHPDKLSEPSREEWVGINLLLRDCEINPRGLASLKNTSGDAKN